MQGHLDDIKLSNLGFQEGRQLDNGLSHTWLYLQVVGATGYADIGNWQWHKTVVRSLLFRDDLRILLQRGCVMVSTYEVWVTVAYDMTTADQIPPNAQSSGCHNSQH